MATRLPRIAPIRKFPPVKWEFTYHPIRCRWETYRMPGDWPEGLFKWLHDTFGRPGLENGWDYHGGWIYITREDYLTMFNLKWS